MAVQAWFESGETPIQPGETRRLTLTIENVGDSTENVTILPTGPTAGWVTVDRPSITLFGQAHDTVEIVVRPPAAHTTAAGATTLSVRVVPLVDPDDTVVPETTLRVQPFDDRRISFLQPMQRARRRTVFEFMVENHGNTMASCRLHLVDPSNRVDGTFDPPAVGVAPGSSSLVRLKLHATSVTFRRRDRQLPFDVEATQTDHDPAIARASLVQPPTVPPRLLTQGLLLVALTAVAIGAWFGVVRPELRDAARDAVDRRIAELTSGTTTVAPDGDGDGALGPGTEPTAEAGEPYTVRLPVRLSVGGTDSAATVVPDGTRLFVTDIVLQNPGADLGTASLARNSEVLYDWDLGAMSSANEFQPRITPLPLDPGDEVVFRATCEGAGAGTATGCNVAVLLSGRLVPVD